MNSEIVSEAEKATLHAAASKALNSAYAPFSGMRVGAAVLADSGRTYIGCNVENSSFGLTICAERSAVFAAVLAEGGDRLRIRAVAVATDGATGAAPCGACRQVINEFGPDAILLYRAGVETREAALNDLLPEAFRLDSRNVKPSTSAGGAVTS